MDAQVESIVARDEIRSVLVRYTRGVDRLDVELIDSTFFPDAIIEHGGMVFDGAHWGAAIVKTMTGACERSRHLIANQSIELDGDVAHSETYCDAHLLINGPDGTHQLLNRAVRYVDQLERRNGEWRIVFRKTVLEWDRIDPIVERPAPLDYVAPLRSRDDVSYLRPLRPEVYEGEVTNGDWVVR